jgi:hypothetical protein
MIMLDGNSGWDNAGNSYNSDKVDTTPANETPAIKKSKPKQEQEISVEDLPF